MASKYDDLDASTELEQQLAVDLRAAFESRGCRVVHHGTNSGGRHSPGGKPDIEIQDPANRRLVLVEVTRRRSSNADGEFPAITDHLKKAITAGGYDDYGLLYISPATSARMSINFRDLWNRTRGRDELQGRIVALDFEAAEMMTAKLAGAPSELYPASRLGLLFDRWDEAVDDARARLLVQQTLFPEDLILGGELEQEAKEYAADRERKLKGQLEKVETALRDYGVTGNAANTVLVYLTFIRLYEERRQRLTGVAHNFTVDGFEAWRDGAPATLKRRYGERMVEALLHEIAEDPELRAADLLRNAAGDPDNLDARVTDRFVIEKLLTVFDEYDFHAGRVDILGAVFETLARRGEKDTRIGQFFTPQPVVDFCVDVVPLTARDVVLDPAVGTARFLIRAMKVMLAKAADDVEPQVRAEAAVRKSRLLGVDIDRWVATIAKMNMFIHGDGKTNIRSTNGLVLGDRRAIDEFPDGLSGQISVVFTNPPLGDTSHRVAADHWAGLPGTNPTDDANVFLDRLGVVPMRVVEEQRLAEAEARLEGYRETVEDRERALPDPVALRQLPGKRRTADRWAARVAELRAAIAAGDVIREPANQSMKGGALFLGAIQDYLQRVRDPNAPAEWRGGWAAIVVDEAILNTPDYGPTRQFIREHFYVKGVVSLARDAFDYLAHTTAKTSMLLLVRKPEDGKAQREPVFFSHAERVGYSPKGLWIGDDLPQVALLFHEVRKTLLRQYQGAWIDSEGAQATVEALPGFGTAFYAHLDPGGTARLDYFNARYLERTRELAKRFGEPSMLGDYLDVAERVSPLANRKGEYEFALVRRITGAVEPKGVQVVDYSPSSLWVVKEGDIVVSGIDAVNGAVGVAGPDVAGLVMSKEMYAYRVKSPSAMSAQYMQLVMRSLAARELLEGMTTGTSNRTRLENAEQLLELPIPPLPSLAEQERVAAEFRTSLERRSEANRLQRQAEAEASDLWGIRALVAPAVDEVLFAEATAV
ncbi:MAG: N-6 DNA methylase [Acidimicrobiales bacterium]